MDVRCHTVRVMYFTAKHITPPSRTAKPGTSCPIDSSVMPVAIAPTPMLSRVVSFAACVLSARFEPPQMPVSFTMAVVCLMKGLMHSNAVP